MKFALVFPGQGSQSVAMMQPFTESQVVKDVFAEASDALGQDLWKLVAEGPAGEKVWWVAPGGGDASAVGIVAAVEPEFAA